MTEPTKKHELPSCIVKKTIEYYKWIGLICGGAAVICGCLYAIVCGILMIGPTIYESAASIPSWAYFVAGIIVTPVIVATVVCINKRKERELNKIDEEFTCPE